jgi:hypothetical protein
MILKTLIFLKYNIKSSFFFQVIKFDCWHSRLSAVQMLQNFGIFNLFLVSDKMKSTIKEILISSLTDEQLEIRLAACLTLTGFFHSGLLLVNEEMIVFIFLALFISLFYIS